MATDTILDAGAALRGGASAFAVALGGAGRKRATAVVCRESEGRAVAIPDGFRRVLHTEVAMKVEPGLVNHPKFLRLKKAVGHFAMEAIIRLWGHCQSGQKGEYWRGADAGYIEAVAMWDGEEGELFAALKAAKVIVVEDNGIRVNDWNRHNSMCVENWRKGGTGGRPKANPRVSNGEPAANPVETQGKPVCKSVSQYAGKSDPDTHNNNNVASPEELKTQYAATLSLIEPLEARRKELTTEQLDRLRSLKKRLREIQQQQAGIGK